MLTRLAILLLSQTFEVQPNTPIAIHVVTPSPSSTVMSRVEISDSLSTLLRKETDFAPQLLEEQELAGCEGALVCFAERTRKRLSSGMLLVISAIGREKDPNLATVLLIDIDRALACRLDEPEGIDLCADQRAVIAEVARTEVRDRAQLESFIARVVTSDLREAFEAAGRWRRTGAIDLHLDQEGVISIDGRELGAARGSVRLTGVPVGLHRIGARYPTGSMDEEIEVHHGDVATLRLATPEWTTPPMRTALLWTGAGVAAVGAALTIWAGVWSASQDKLEACRSKCHGRFITFEQIAGERALDEHGGVLAIPFGYSLIAAGGAWIAGSLLFDSDVPWIEALIGLGVGLASYGLTALVDASL